MLRWQFHLALGVTYLQAQPVGNIFSVKVRYMEHLGKNWVLERFKSLRQDWSAPSLTFPPDHSYGPVTGAVQHRPWNRGALFSFLSHLSYQSQPGLYQESPSGHVTSARGLPVLLIFNCLDRTGVNQVLNPAPPRPLCCCCCWCSSPRLRFLSILFAWGFCSSTAVLCSGKGKRINID